MLRTLHNGHDKKDSCDPGKSEERSEGHLKVDDGQLPVDPTDQVMLRLKLLEALIDMSRFLLAYRKRAHTCTMYCSSQSRHIHVKFQLKC